MPETNTTKDLLNAARAVVGIEVLDAPADESARPILTFYTDQKRRLVDTLEKCRRDEVSIWETSPQSVGLFRRAVAK